MAKTKPRIYMCACCLIDYVKHAVGKPLDQGREAEVWYIQQLLQANYDGEIEVYTSANSVAECTHVGDENITKEVRDHFTRLLTSGQYLTLIQPEPFVAEDARDLRWNHGIPLSGMDAMHVASALAQECDEFLTTDVKRKGPIHQADKIAKLGMRVIRPSQTGLITGERRQMTMGGVQPVPVGAKRRRGKKRQKKS